jgi:hypothetical protein
MQQQVERSSVRPVQVFQHDQQRLHGACRSQETGDRLKQPPAVLFGLTGRAWLNRQPLAHLADDPGKVRGRGPKFRPQCLDRLESASRSPSPPLIQNRAYQFAGTRLLSYLALVMGTLQIVTMPVEELPIDVPV